MKISVLVALCAIRTRTRWNCLVLLRITTVSTLCLLVTYFFTRPFVILLGRSRSATEAKTMGVASGLGMSVGADK